MYESDFLSIIYPVTTSKIDTNTNSHTTYTQTALNTHTFKVFIGCNQSRQRNDNNDKKNRFFPLSLSVCMENHIKYLKKISSLASWKIKTVSESCNNIISKQWEKYTVFLFENSTLCWIAITPFELNPKYKVHAHQFNIFLVPSMSALLCYGSAELRNCGTAVLTSPNKTEYPIVLMRTLA